MLSTNISAISSQVRNSHIGVVCGSRESTIDKLRKEAYTVAFKVEMQFSDGTSDLDDEIFEIEDAAYDHGLYLLSCHDLGAEILHDSNPGDYPEADSTDEPEFRVNKIDK